MPKCGKNRKKREKIAKFLYEYKLNHPCIKCGEKDIYKLTFHHRNPNDKIHSVASHSFTTVSAVMKEINKCDVLCYDCHDKEHNIVSKETNNLIHFIVKTIINDNCKCINGIKIYEIDNKNKSHKVIISTNKN
jgi:uncharacterized protein YktB (UPF0637 family)